jgi:hypothetical protein
MEYTWKKYTKKWAILFIYFGTHKLSLKAIFFTNFLNMIYLIVMKYEKTPKWRFGIFGLQWGVVTYTPRAYL